MSCALVLLLCLEDIIKHGAGERATKSDAGCLVQELESVSGKLKSCLLRRGACGKARLCRGVVR